MKEKETQNDLNDLASVVHGLNVLNIVAPTPNEDFWPGHNFTLELDYTVSICSFPRIKTTKLTLLMD